MSNKIKQCKQCLYTELHPLNLNINDDGVCTGCIIHQEKYSIDWSKRFKELKKTVSHYKSNYRYDCIVPVCGGKDSFYIVHVVKNILGLTPLLVSFNRVYNTTEGICNLEKIRDTFGCDLITQTFNPLQLKKITKVTLKLMGSMHWPYLAGHTVFPVQVAVRLNIPLIIWGAHQGIDQVGMFSHNDYVEMTKRYRSEHDLMGIDPETLLKQDNELTSNDLAKLFYPTDKQLLKTGVRGIYLNNYLFWDSIQQHQEMITKYKYFSSSVNNTYDIYNDIHDFHYNKVHDYIKQVKHGYSKITDHVCRDIRLNKITREQGISLVNSYEANAFKLNDDLCNFLNITQDQLFNLIEEHRNMKIWQKSAYGWKSAIKIIDNNKKPHKFNLASNHYTKSRKNIGLHPLLLRGGHDITREKLC
jgi:N-acetyl sugar amidotransferase